MASLRARLRALADARVPFDKAERLLAPTLGRATDLGPQSTAARNRAEREEFARTLMLKESAQVARERRLTRWLGLDLAEPPEEERKLDARSEES